MNKILLSLALVLLIPISGLCGITDGNISAKKKLFIVGDSLMMYIGPIIVSDLADTFTFSEDFDTYAEFTNMTGCGLWVWDTTNVRERSWWNNSAAGSSIGYDVIVAYEPDVVLIMTGMNDLIKGWMYAGNQVDTIADYYQSLIQRLRGDIPGVKIVFVIEYPWRTDRAGDLDETLKTCDYTAVDPFYPNTACTLKGNSNLKMFRDEMVTVLTSLNVDYVDLYQVWVDRWTLSKTDRAFQVFATSSNDGVHLKNDGAQWLVDNYVKGLLVGALSALSLNNINVQ